MKNIVLGFMVAFGFLSSAIPALAYSLPSPVVVSDSFVGGQGEVDFSVPSRLDAIFFVENASTNDNWLTVGDVAHGLSGYGFKVASDQLMAVSSDGSLLGPLQMPIGYPQPKAQIEVHAAYSPVEKTIQFETASPSSYSKGVIQDSLPQPIKGAAFNAQVMNHGVPSSISAELWNYTQ